MIVVVAKDAIVTGNVSSSGNVVVSKDTIVTGNVSSSGNVVVSKDAIVTGNVSSSGNVVVSKDAIVTGNVSTSGNVVVAKDAIVTGNVSTSGNVVVTREILVSGNIKGLANATISGNVSAANVNASLNYKTYVVNKPAINVVFTGNIVASANISLDNENTNILTFTNGNVGVNSVTLGTHTVGDYVKTISGTSSNIAISGGTGIGSTPTVNLVMTAVPPGHYGNANVVGSFVVTRDGRLTDASNVAIDRRYYLVSNKPAINLLFTGNIVGNANLTLSSEGTNFLDRKSTRLNSSHTDISRMPSSA